MYNNSMVAGVRLADVEMVVTSTSWYLTDGVVQLHPFREEHVAAAATACADASATSMLRNTIFDVSASDATARQDRIRDLFLSVWSFRYETFAVFAQTRRDVRNRPVFSCVGVRALIDTAHQGVDSCGGWIHAAHRGRGLGSAALKVALTWSFASRGSSAVVVGTKSSNVAAQANLAACGFRRSDPDAPVFARAFEHGFEEWVCRDVAPGAVVVSRPVRSRAVIGSRR